MGREQEEFMAIRLRLGDELEAKQKEIANLRAELSLLKGEDLENWTGTLCPTCGPSVKVDEDGCCLMCGNGAMGPGVEAMMEIIDERDQLREQVCDMDQNVHELKTWPDPFNAILRGYKKHEIRKQDRDFKVGDVLILKEWDPATERYTDQFINVKVTYMTSGGEWGLPDDLCVMSIEMLGTGTYPW